MKKAVSILLALSLVLGLGAAAAEAVPDGMPAAYPVSAERAVTVLNEGARRIDIRVGDSDRPVPCFVVPEETAHLRIEIAAEDDPDAMILRDGRNVCRRVSELPDPDRGAFVIDLETAPGADGETVRRGLLADGTLMDDDPEGILFFVIPEERYAEEAADLLRRAGRPVTGWEYASPAAPEAPRAYRLHVRDQHGGPVANAAVTFCTDSACVMAMSDEAGLITFDGPPDDYHVQLIRVPAGYGFPADLTLNTGREYGEWVLRVRKE